MQRRASIIILTLLLSHCSTEKFHGGSGGSVGGQHTVREADAHVIPLPTPTPQPNVQVVKNSQDRLPDPTCEITVDNATMPLGQEVRVSMTGNGEFSKATLNGDDATLPYSINHTVLADITFNGVVENEGTGQTGRCSVDVTAEIPPPAPDLSVCASLGAASYGPYRACPANYIMKIINDGASQAMSCCPVSAGVLVGTHMARYATCGANEVMTAKGLAATELYCTALNTDYFELGTPVGSQLQTAAWYPTSHPMHHIIAQYKIGDACVCAGDTVMIGGAHSGADNYCAEQCAEIIRK